MQIVLMQCDDGFNRVCGIRVCQIAFRDQFPHHNGISFVHRPKLQHLLHLGTESLQFLREKLLIVSPQHVTEQVTMLAEEHVMKNLRLFEGMGVKTAVNRAIFVVG